MSSMIYRNQRGFGAPIIIALLIVVLGVAGGAYYLITKDKDSNGAAANKQAVAECNRAIEDKDLCKLATNYKFDGNYTMTMTTTANGETATWIVKTDGDNSHTIASAAGQAAAEYISFEGSTYVKTPGSNTWTKYPASPETDGDQDDLTSDIKDDFDFTDEEAVHYTKIGKEACGNLTCFHYRYSNPAEPESAYDFWFDDKEYKIRKVTGTQEGGTSEIVFTYGDASVAAPSDYTEAPDFSSGISEEQMQQLMEQYGTQ